MKRRAGNKELRSHAGSEVTANDDNLRRAIWVEQQHLKGIAQVVVVHLIIANPVQPDLGVRRDEEIEDRALRSRAAVVSRQRRRRYLKRASVGFRYEAAGRM